jgi:hypothetical protein
MEYGVWNRDYDLHKKWRRPSGSEEKVDPSTETGKKSHTQRRQPSKQIALQIDSPPNIEKQDGKRKKKNKRTVPVRIPYKTGKIERRIKKTKLIVIRDV